VVALAWTSAAAAQEPADDVQRTALARSLFREGVALSDGEQWAEAADRFRRSLALRDSPIVAFNLGTACMHTGRLVEAAELFGRASRDEDAPERLRAAARQLLGEVEPRLARLTIEASGPRDGVTLELDGQAVLAARVGIGAPSDPGHHVLRALRGGEEVARAEVDVAERGEATLRLEIPPPVAEIAAVAAVTEVTETDPLLEVTEPPPGDDSLAIWLGTIGAVLAVAIAVTVVTVVVVDGQGSAPPIEGNLGPPVIVFD
jgi:hypothetical protein